MNDDERREQIRVLRGGIVNYERQMYEYRHGPDHGEPEAFERYIETWRKQTLLRDHLAALGEDPYAPPEPNPPPCLRDSSAAA